MPSYGTAKLNSWNQPVSLPDGAHVLVTVLNDDDQVFWQHASESAIKHIWDNDEDDIYAELLTA